MKHWSAIGTITASLAILSTLAACYIVISAIRFLRYVKSNPHADWLKDPLVFVKVVLSMSVCDVIFEFIESWQELSAASEDILAWLNEGYSNTACIIKGYFLEYFTVASASWNFILVLILLQILLFRTNLTKISSNLKYYHLFVWLFSLIASTIPLFYQKYGYVTNQNENYWIQCAINDSKFRLFIYAPIAFYMLFAIGLLLYYVYLRYVYRKTKIGNLSMQIVYFTIMFVIVWIFPLLDRIYDIHKFKTNSGKVAWLHDIGRASVGLSNALVWGSSNLWKRYSKQPIAKESGSQFEVADDTVVNSSTASSPLANQLVEDEPGISFDLMAGFTPENENNNLS